MMTAGIVVAIAIAAATSSWSSTVTGILYMHRHCRETQLKWMCEKYTVDGVTLNLRIIDEIESRIVCDLKGMYGILKEMCGTDESTIEINSDGFPLEINFTWMLSFAIDAWIFWVKSIFSVFFFNCKHSLCQML